MSFRTERRDEIALMYRQGFSGPQIADKFGVSFKLIYTILDDADVPKRRCGVQPWDTKTAAIRTLLRQGLTRKEIADETGWSIRSIAYHETNRLDAPDRRSAEFRQWQRELAAE